MALKPVNRDKTLLAPGAPQSPQSPTSGRALAVSRHSVSLNTGLFSLGFSWQRLEVEPPPVAQVAKTAPIAAGETKIKPWDGPPRPQEMRRRLDLAALLLSPLSPAKADSEDGAESQQAGKILGPLGVPALKA